MTAVEELAVRLRHTLGDKISNCVVATGQVTIEVPANKLLEVCLLLRDTPVLGFEQLMDACGVDYSAYGQADWKTDRATDSGYSRGVKFRAYQEIAEERPRFAVVYQLLSIKNNQRVRVRTYAEGEPPRVPSVVEIWNSANWYEREAFDLYGILFEGHPDLRRILTDYGFIGHPFRKDFPLEGHVEVRYDPDKKRVVYQPVTIENRVLVPRVIRKEYPRDYPTDAKPYPANAPELKQEQKNA